MVSAWKSSVETSVRASLASTSCCATLAMDSEPSGDWFGSAALGWEEEADESIDAGPGAALDADVEAEVDAKDALDGVEDAHILRRLDALGEDPSSTMVDGFDAQHCYARAYQLASCSLRDEYHQVGPGQFEGLTPFPAPSTQEEAQRWNLRTAGGSRQLWKWPLEGWTDELLMGHAADGNTKPLQKNTGYTVQRRVTGMARS